MLSYQVQFTGSIVHCAKTDHGTYEPLKNPLIETILTVIHLLIIPFSDRAECFVCLSGCAVNVFCAKRTDLPQMP